MKLGLRIPLKKMRLRLVRGILILALLGNIIVWHKIWRLFTIQQHTSQSKETGVVSENPQKFHRRLARLVTIVIRQFETFENDVATTVESILNSFPVIQILIVCDEVPYPPLELNLSNSSSQNVRLVNLQPGFNKSFDERNPLFYVHTKFVLILPDATRISSKHMLQDMINHATKVGTTSVPVGRSSLNCFNMGLKVKEWSLRITNDGGTVCDAVIGRHVMMMETALLRKLSDPFMLPFTDALYMQTRAVGVKISTYPVTKNRLTAFESEMSSFKSAFSKGNSTLPQIEKKTAELEMQSVQSFTEYLCDRLKNNCDKSISRAWSQEVVIDNFNSLKAGFKSN